MNKTIVFIHGAWLNSLSWENVIAYFESKGYTCTAPEWPYRDQDKTAAELRENTPPELAEVGLKELTDHYESIVRDYPEPPILIGHSFGGLIVQQLLDRGLGSAGVAFDSAAPEGVLAVDWTVLKVNSGILFGWMNWEKVVYMSYPEWQFAFTNTFPEEEQQRCYDRYLVPESGRLFFQAAFAQLDPHHALRVNFKNNDRAPLLLTAGELDHVVPAHVCRSNYAHYKHSSARTDFKEFPGRVHLLLSQEGWEEVAGFAADWLDHIATGATGKQAAVSSR
jgi:pimeloyl-ACP methyl ester carboxylesterase